MTTRFLPKSSAWRDGLRHPAVTAGLGLIALQLVYRSWAVFAGFFYTDDYQLLLRAEENDLSSAYLLEPANSHVIPGIRFLVWLVERAGPLNWELAGTITVLLQLMASVSCLWMLVTLFGRRWFVLAPLALYLTSAITAQATLWWVSSLSQVSVQAAFFLSVGCWVQYLRTRRLEWLFGSALAVAFGLLFFQKVLLVLPVLIFLAFVYFAQGSIWRRTVQLVRGYWPALLVMGVVAGSYTWYSLVEVQQPFTRGKDLNLLDLAWHMLGAAVVGVLGGPWRWSWRPGGAWVDTPEWLIAAGLLVVLVVAAFSMLTRRRAVWAWLMMLGYLGLQVVLVATSRAPVFGSEIGLAYRLQTDVICAVVLGIGLAFATLPGAEQSSLAREQVRGPACVSTRLSRPVPPSWVVTGLTLISLSGVLCWADYARLWHDHNVSKSYFGTLDRDLGRSGRIDLVDGPVPEGVMPSAFFAPDNRVSNLIRLLGRSADFPDSSSRLAVVGADGALREGLIEPVVVNQPGEQPNCGWLGASSKLRIPLAGSTYDFGWWLRLGYLSNSEDLVTVVAGDDRVAAKLEKGLASLYVRAQGEIDSVTLTGLEPETRICVDVVQVGNMKGGRRL